MTTYANSKNGAVINTDITREQAIEILTPFKADSDFIRSLVYNAKNNTLSPNQAFWLFKIAVEKNPTTERPKVGDGFKKVMEMFQRAKAKGLAKPRIKLKKDNKKIVLSLAGDNSANKGAVYVKSDGEYCGKVTPEGEWRAVSSCPQDITDYLKAFADNPLEAMENFARETGNCSCCGRLLTKAESILRMVGPVCFENYFN